MGAPGAHQAQLKHDRSDQVRAADDLPVGQFGVYPTVLVRLVGLGEQ